MRKIIWIILTITILSLFQCVYASSIDELNLSSTHYGVYTLNDLRDLGSKNTDEKVPVASITKVMTAIVCMENVEDLNQKVIVDLPEVKKYYDEEYSVAGLKDKQEISYYDLIATMLIPSGADSAVCIALNVFGSYSKFIEAMNQKAKELEMNNTSFSNPIGSDDENNYSTVYELALMMKYALNNETLKYLMSQYDYTTKDESITVHNALFVLADIYGLDISKISGGKTGMTGDAGYCLASYSDKLQKPVICIVLGSKIQKGTLYHLEDSQKLYKYIEENFELKNIVTKGEKIISLPAYHSVKDSVPICAADDIQFFLPKEENIDKEKIKIDYSGIELLSSENNKDEITGKVSIYYNNYYLGEVETKIGEDIKFSIIKCSKDNKKIVLIIIIVLVFLILRMLKKYSNKRFNKKYHKKYVYK